MGFFVFLIGSLILPGALHTQTPSWFTDVTEEVGLYGKTVFRLYVTDVNNDLYPDIVVIRGGADVYTEDPLRLYINTQNPGSVDPTDRIFVDMTDESGINSGADGDPGRRTSLVGFADVDNDGDVDMVSGIYYHRIENYTDNGDRSEVLLNDGEGHFTVVSNNGIHELGLINSTGFSFLDYNKDGNVDLYSAVFFLDYTNNIWNHGYLLEVMVMVHLQMFLKR